jgi:hypothetical protein
MTSYLFGAWISCFIELVQESGSISPEHRHLLILDGYISHVNVEVVQEARRAGLDLLILPSHTSHALQPLDVSIFKPFKQFFGQYKDYWISMNLNQPASKDILVQWVSLSLKKALTENNIRKGFSGTGIWPLNVHVVDSMLGPSELFSFPLEEENMRYENLGASSQPCLNDGKECMNRPKLSIVTTRINFMRSMVTGHMARMMTKQTMRSTTTRKSRVGNLSKWGQMSPAWSRGATAMGPNLRAEKWLRTS